MFGIVDTDDTGARNGRLHTAHGKIETPCFLPVATKGSVKTLTFEDLKSIGFQSFISNALLLYLRPGLKTISGAGGLHSFIGWDKCIFTDSGGYQMLNSDFMEGITGDGVLFRSPFDRSKHTFTPEICMEIQNILASDVAMVLDTLIPAGADRNAIAKAVKTTTEWARRCKEAHKNDSQMIFAITQGGIYSDLRERSAREVIEIGFDGYAIGGLSIGEPKEVMLSILKEQTAILPRDKPRYLMGVGSPSEVLESIALGVDIFDSTFPTRNARHNDAYTRSGEINLSRGKYRDDFTPIDDRCGCYTCKTHTRAYVHHLLRNHEPTALTLMTLHNLYFMHKLIEDSKQAIAEGVFNEFKKETVTTMKSDPLI